MQVKSGTLFDNVLICDDPEYAKTLAEETWGKQKDVWCILSIVKLVDLILWIKGSVCWHLNMLKLQAEKAAFDEAEKKREEEV